MLVVPVLLPCSTGDLQRYMATITTPNLIVVKMGLTHFGAITACLGELNKRTFYDPTY